MSDHNEVLIGKFLSGNASAGETAQLERWRSESATNEAAFAEAEKIWLASGALRQQVESDVDAAWSDFSARVAKPQAKVIRLQPLKIAAAIALLITTFFLVRFFMLPGEERVSFTANVAANTDTVEYIEPAVAAETPDSASVTGSPVKHKPFIRKRSAQLAMIAISSEDSAMTFTLPDNSRVYLNKHSKLTYAEAFKGSERAVHLSGEAYFEPAESAEPFFVYCRDTKTSALAAAFNVSGYDNNQIEISVIKGLVEITKVSPSETRIIIGKGEKVAYDAEKEQFVQSKLARKERWWKSASFRMKIRNFFNRIIHGK